MRNSILHTLHKHITQAHAKAMMDGKIDFGMVALRGVIKKVRLEGKH